MINIEQALGELNFLFRRGRLTYDAYQKNNCTFLYAQILKENNDRIRDILIRFSYLFPEEVIPECVKLMHHLDVWSTIWISQENTQKPTISEEFVFNNKVNYPHSAEFALMKLYESIKEKR